MNSPATQRMLGSRWWLAGILCLGACGDWVIPGRIEAQAPGFRLEVLADPFGFAVQDAGGQDLLRTTSAGAGEDEGTSALGWAEGRCLWETVYSPGYFKATPELSNWRDDFVAVGLRRVPEGIEAVLSPRSMTEIPDERVRVRFTVAPGRLRVEVVPEGRRPRAFAATFDSPADEGFLGFGERFTRVDQRGLDVSGWAEEGGLGGGEGLPPGPENPFPNGEAMSYYPVPFFLSTRGYGFWLDSTWYHQFNLATLRPDAWRVWHLGATLAFEVYVPLPGDGRPWPYQLIDAFTERTGRPMLPPAWTFGPRRRIGRGDRQGEVSEIQAMRDLDLAITAVDDALHILPRGSHVGIEDPLRAWTASARELGYRVCAYYNPYLATKEQTPLQALVDEGLEKGYFLRDADGNPSEVWLISGGLGTMLTVDFTSEATTAWYQGMLEWGLGLGYSGWMYDFGEYVQPEVVSASGMTGEELHNLFPVLYQRAAHEVLERERPGDWLTFVRSGYTGASAFSPMVWSGDPAASFEESDGLPSMVRAGINLGISGVPHWGGDINGFHCVADGYAAADEELLVRWIQQGAMTPNMQDQDACSAAFDSGRKANIFDDPEAQAAWRTYARLHTRLFPYLYTLAHRAHASGEPILRALFLEHPSRDDLAGIDGAYYLGPALLVAPVVHRGEREKRLVLPDGLYADWDDGSLVAGGGEVALPAPLSKLPLLLRDGFLVPLLDPAIDTLAEEQRAEIVGPGDVADVLDVKGLLSTGAWKAEFTLWDGGGLAAWWSGGFSPGGLEPAADEGWLRACTGCYLEQVLSPGVRRVRLSMADGEVRAGGLVLRAETGRRVRWDLTLVD